jgi:hypothetical protein
MLMTTNSALAIRPGMGPELSARENPISTGMNTASETP